jgi:hypothetical protein
MRRLSIAGRTFRDRIKNEAKKQPAAIPAMLQKGVDSIGCGCANESYCYDNVKQHRKQQRGVEHSKSLESRIHCRMAPARVMHLGPVRTPERSPRHEKFARETNGPGLMKIDPGLPLTWVATAHSRLYLALPTSFSTSFNSLGTALDKISGAPSVIKMVSSTR